MLLLNTFSSNKRTKILFLTISQSNVGKMEHNI